MTILAIVGSRKVKDIKALEKIMELLDLSVTLIISGGCPAGGADNLAQEYARKNNIPFAVILPEKMEARYFHKRNKDIATVSDTILILFHWPEGEEPSMVLDDKHPDNRGSRSVLGYARKLERDCILYAVGKNKLRKL